MSRVVPKALLSRMCGRAYIHTITGIERINSKRFLSTMSAWQLHKYGGNEQLGLTNTARIPPILNPQDVLIKVYAASVNPIDVAMRGGYGSKLLNILRKSKCSLENGSEFPLTLGRDCSGVVVETGKAVRNIKPGDHVWAAPGVHRPGTHAQYTVASINEISRKPASLSHNEAASLPYVAMTTWAALCTVGELREKVAPNLRVLVIGGSGGVGTFAIQLLRAWDAEVTVTCSTDAVHTALSLGADVAIDYKTQDVPTELKRIRGFDLILDTVGGDTPHYSLDLLKTWRNSKYVSIVSPLLSNTDSLGVPGGLLKSIGSLGSHLLKGASQGRSFRWAFFMPNGKALQKVADLVDAGKVRPVVERTLPFEALPEAYSKVEAGHSRGKTVISFSTEDSPES